MKKITIISSAIIAMIIAAVIAFDSGAEPSANNEGLPKNMAFTVKK